VKPAPRVEREEPLPTEEVAEANRPDTRNDDRNADEAER
jgi:hypothetical protein